MKKNHHFFKLENDLAGFVMENVIVEPGETVQYKLQTRGVLTSDDALFHKYIEQLFSEYFKTVVISPDAVNKFLVVTHSDQTADLYVNEFDISIEIVTKRNIKEGDLIMASDVANITKLHFPKIEIKETDKLVFCAKIGWRFGLFFDLTPRTEKGSDYYKIAPVPLDVDDAYKTLGSMYRYLNFHHVYKILESESLFADMIQDGWFPFIEILTDYKELDDIYKNKHGFENRLDSFIEQFDADRIKKITSKWWGNPTFSEKKTLIEAGIEAYLQNTHSGFINAIKNLVSEIEGILRKLYQIEVGKADKVKSPDLINFITDNATKKSGSEFSLLLPTPFLQYLKDVVFAKFDATDSDVALSRNSASHGVVEAVKYTKARALQLILVLDQVYFYK